VNSADPVFAEDNVLLEHIAAALRLVVDQVLDFAPRA
jgi:hypothetical protein